MTTDWSQWHEAYERPGSSLPDRLAAVRAQLSRHRDDGDLTPLEPDRHWFTFVR